MPVLFISKNVICKQTHNLKPSTKIAQALDKQNIYYSTQHRLIFLYSLISVYTSLMFTFFSYTEVQI